MREWTLDGAAQYESELELCFLCDGVGTVQINHGELPCGKCNQTGISNIFKLGIDEIGIRSESTRRSTSGFIH